MNQPQDLYQEVRAGRNIKTFLLDLHSRNAGELPALKDTDKLEALPTLLMPVLLKPVPPLFSLHQLYIDQDGRQCFRIEDLLADTIDLVSIAIQQFCKLTGHYPDEIVPCPSRYILLRFGHFCPVGGLLIPFSCDFPFPIDYDVVVRGWKRE